MAGAWSFLGYFSPLILLALWPQAAAAHREHKVHNIVLYPDKHSWCKTTPIKQVVGGVTGVGSGDGGGDGASGDGGVGGGPRDCESVEIDNHVCVGACFSYTIPRTLPSSPGDAIKPYCDSCQPSAVQWKEVTLECRGGRGDDDMTLGSGGSRTGAKIRSTVVRRVQVITNCSCSACDAAPDSIHQNPTHPALSPHHSASFASLHPDGIPESHHEVSEDLLQSPHADPPSEPDGSPPAPRPASSPIVVPNNHHHHHHHHHHRQHHPAPHSGEFLVPPTSIADSPSHPRAAPEAIVPKGKSLHEVPELMGLMRETHERKASGVGGVVAAGWRKDPGETLVGDGEWGGPEGEEKLRNLLGRLVAPMSAESADGGASEGSSSLTKRLEAEGARVRVDPAMLRRVLATPDPSMPRRVLAGGVGPESRVGGADPTLEVAPHSLRPARDGTEMSYHDNPSPGSPAEEAGRKRADREDGVEEEEF